MTYAGTSGADSKPRPFISGTQEFLATHKEQALWDWIVAPPTMDNPDSSFLFGAIRSSDSSAALMPVSDRPVRTYVDGTEIREYTFALQINLTLSTDDDGTNIGNMLAMRTWQEWVAKKAKENGFPDFGENCGDYRLRVGDVAPQLSRVQGNNRARHDFFATIIYKEARNGN